MEVKLHLAISHSDLWYVSWSYSLSSLWQGNGLSEDIVRKRAGETEQVTEPCDQASPSPALALRPLPELFEATSKDTPEYAVVRKALRKSQSLPESPCVPDTALPPLQVWTYAYQQSHTVEIIFQNNI